MSKYRLNVAGIFRNAKGKILVAERSDFPGSWQFPQGGVSKGENEREAFAREMEEELGVDASNYRILREERGYRYDFPDTVADQSRYRGQAQIYYLCAYEGDGEDIRVDTADPEFRDFRWIDVNGFELAWVPEFKRDVYRRVFREFFSVELDSND